MRLQSLSAGCLIWQSSLHHSHYRYYIGQPFQPTLWNCQPAILRRIWFFLKRQEKTFFKLVKHAFRLLVSISNCLNCFALLENLDHVDLNDFFDQRNTYNITYNLLVGIDGKIFSSSHAIRRHIYHKQEPNIFAIYNTIQPLYRKTKEIWQTGRGEGRSKDKYFRPACQVSVSFLGNLGLNYPEVSYSWLGYKWCCIREIS